MKKDVQDQLAIFKELDEQEQIDWEPEFNPIIFNEKHKPLTMNEYALDAETLAKHGVQITNLRKEIYAKAEKLAPKEEGKKDSEKAGHSRVGQKYSKAYNQLSQTEFREREQ